MAALVGACSNSVKGNAAPSTSATKPSAEGKAPAIDMSKATSAGCKPATGPGPAHPDPLVARVFHVSDAVDAPYLLGWQIVPYRGASRSYAFGTGGNVLALQPAAGGRPLGYATGTVTFGRDADAGSIDAVITLKDKRTVSITGSWHCAAQTSPTVAVPVR